MDQQEGGAALLACTQTHVLYSHFTYGSGCTGCELEFTELRKHLYLAISDLPFYITGSPLHPFLTWSTHTY